MGRDSDEPVEDVDDGQKAADEDRRAILSRRNRLIAIAFTGLTGAAGCYDSHQVGDPPVPTRDAGTDAGFPGPCLGAPLMDAGEPVPCLEAPLMDAGAPTPCLGALPDAGAPTPCLDVAPIEDAGPDGALPTPCLTI